MNKFGQGIWPSLGLGLVLLLAACGPQPTNVPPDLAPAPPIEAPAEVPGVAYLSPAEGALMSWVDGSTLAYIDFCKTPACDGGAGESKWVFQSEVSNHQFSMCVEAGACAPSVSQGNADVQCNSLPVGERNSLIECRDFANSPAQIIGPDAPQEYCNWAGGRVPSKDEAAVFEGNMLGAANPDLYNTLIGLLSPSTENGVRCIVDAPGPMAPACQTSAFYLNGAPEFSEASMFAHAGAFCQQGESYVTVDINPPEGSTLQSVNGDCEIVTDNRMLCDAHPSAAGDPPSTNGNASVAFFFAYLPAVQDNSVPAVPGNYMPSAGELQCQPGYEVNGDAPTQCDFGPPAQSRLIQPAMRVRLVLYQPKPAQVNSLQAGCPKPLTLNAETGKCTYDIPPVDLASGREPGGCPPGSFGMSFGFGLFCVPTEPPPDADGHCPVGYLAISGRCVRDPSPLRGAMGGLAGLFAPANKDGSCPEGYSLDSSGLCLRNAARNPDGSCPEGYTLDPAGHCARGAGRLPSVLTNFAGLLATPDKDGNCPEGYQLDPGGLCVRGRPAPDATAGCPPGSTRVSFGVVSFCSPTEPPPDADGHCPVGYLAISGRCVRDPSPLRGALGGLAGLFAPVNKDGSCPDGYSMDVSGLCIRNAARNPDGSCPEGYTLDAAGRCTRGSTPLPSFLSGFSGLFATPDKDGNCPEGYGLDPGGLCVRGRPARGADGCPAGTHRLTVRGLEFGCIPDFPVGCPVGTYFDEDLGLCIAPGESTSLTLTGFHFDEASQCSRTDLPSGRYPGCPEGQAYDPTTGDCDAGNAWGAGGEVLYTINIVVDVPACAGDTGGDSGGGGSSCKGLEKPKCTTTPGCNWDGVSCS